MKGIREKAKAFSNMKYASLVTCLFLVCCAFCYYAFYYRCSLYPSGEGGSEAVIALRLMSGQIPMVDVTLGYNLLWFYPIVALFKIVGPSYTALRIYFFGLATCTALLSFAIIKMTTKRHYYALLGGLLTLLLPGQLFRNYMALVVMLNMAIFLKAFLFSSTSTSKRLFWMAAAGVSLGITFLIRVDLGFFLSAIFLGLIPTTLQVSRPAHKANKNFLQQLFIALAGLLLAVTAVLALHVPFYQHALHRGFASSFLEQYEAFPKMLLAREKNGLSLFKKADAPHAITSSPSSPQEPTTTSVAAPPPPTHQEATTLTRRSFFSARKIRERQTALNLYLPLPASLLLLAMASSFFFFKKREQQSHSLSLLICLGCSSTLFPQYFFWRPDMVHFSEFMVPMMTTMLIGTIFALDAYKKASLLFRVFISIFCFFSITALLFYLDDALQSQSTGGIAISQKRRIEFVGENGVRVKLTPQEFEDTSAIYRSVMTHSNLGDYVICYPYNAEINFMTNRPSYRQNLYVDDLIAPSDFDTITIAEIEKYHPAVIVVTDWPINGTEHSRFTVWAAGAYDYIKTHYLTDYEHGIIHVFVKP